jgi:hypothetical protein
MPAVRQCLKPPRAFATTQDKLIAAYFRRYPMARFTPLECVWLPHTARVAPRVLGPKHSSLIPF